MGVDDVGAETLRGSACATCKVRVATAPSTATVDDDTLDLVAPVDERALEILDEDAEVGIARARVHLRDEEDLHVRRPRALQTLGVVRAVELAQRAAELPDRAAGAQGLSHREEQVPLLSGNGADLGERGGDGFSVA